MVKFLPDLLRCNTLRIEGANLFRVKHTVMKLSGLLYSLRGNASHSLFFCKMAVE